MAVPPFHEMMLPFLKRIADGQEHTAREMVDYLAKELALSDADLADMLPSGRQTKYQNRVYWARVYLGKALLLEGTGRGRFRITKRGIDLLATKPEVIDLKTLAQYPEYLAFQKSGQSDLGQASEPQITATATPEEAIEAGYKTLRDELAASLLKQLTASKPAFFEQVVVDLLVAMGYGGSREDAGKAVGRSGDGGIDGIIKEDRLGLDIVYIQAKRWENNVGRPEVQAFVGVLVGKGASKGVMITTARFSKEAYEFIKYVPQKVVLIDGQQLSHLMIEFNIGVTPTATYELKKLDLDYFEGE